MPDAIHEQLLQNVGGPSVTALDRLIYIVGSARGGTSITQAILSLHSSVIAMKGPSSFLNHVWRYRNKVHERLWRQLLWTPHYLRRAAVRDSLPREQSRAYTRLINSAVRKRNLRSLYQLYPLTLALDPVESAPPETYVAWLDKGNDFWGVDELRHAFPNGRFVFVLRDPRGAISSAAKRIADLRADTVFEIEPRDILKAAIYWQNLVRQELSFARRNPSQCVLVRFEDLTARPVETAQSLFAELDLPPMPADELSKSIDGLAYGSSNDADDTGSGVRQTPNERWKTNLSVENLDIVLTVCGRTASKLGYDCKEPIKRRDIGDLVGLVPGWKSKLEVLAKLLFLRLWELPRTRTANPSLLQPETIPKI